MQNLTMALQPYFNSSFDPFLSDPALLADSQTSSNMAMHPDSRPHTSYNSQGVPQSLPPITALTSDLPLPGEPSPLLRRQHEDIIRDSGNYSMASQSKRKLFNPSTLLTTAL
jgi:hypothetical protein